MLDLSLLMYPIADLRHYARNEPETFRDPNGLLEDPIVAGDFVEFLSENAQTITDIIGKRKSTILNQVLETTVSRRNTTAKQQKRRHPTAFLERFSDGNSNTQLVYAIAIDRARKRVIVCFRGTVSTEDKLRDIQFRMERIPNPLKDMEGQPETLRIHKGFYDYLFYPTTSGETREDGTPKSKYERILDQTLVFLKQNPDYKLFVTGHSLGAALGSLFSFLAAADERTPKPVTCISIASPFVGGRHFRRAHHCLKRIPNPLKDMEGQPETLRIHKGFYDYLFYPTTSGETREDGTPKSKYERILDQTLVFLKQNPDYKLFVTGHSLGAALGSLFSFLAAADERTPKPVTCISIASPFVGGRHFRRAHHLLERTKKLQYVRVQNSRDIVPLVPPVAWNFGLYKHVGLEIKLFPDARYEMVYTQGNHTKRIWGNSLFNNLSLNPIKKHSPLVYDDRLEAVRNDLERLYLHDIFEEIAENARK
eukprot:CAMPEP_0116844270 /NCGR_PEP_ID=MMETSP0418-20121206/12570_1 /TAXON_ID=1158023 /ORGANISM="Astrosyne radiata, Strain 13vi08-1A" /LENGTH=479 /DNA_ID=CAMNT_0004475155 /DNA_START=1 /DNA_END=1440 /DNA_ORIENTATION=+